MVGSSLVEGSQLIDVRVKDPVDKSDTWALVWVLVG